MSQLNHLDLALHHLTMAGIFEASVHTGAQWPDRARLQRQALKALRQAYRQTKAIRSTYARLSLAMRQK